ncbi:MAG: hypothetical protein ACE15B_19390 [Bryobacteraceae bacterium]
MTIEAILRFVFGCHHKRTARPLSMLDGRRVPCYVACLDCGRELPYDWRHMRIQARPETECGASRRVRVEG